MSTAALITIADYLGHTDKPNCEYIDGVLLPKAMPTTLHAFIQSAIMLLLGKQGVLALPELTLHVGPTRFLVPDVAVVQRMEHPYPTTPALLCVEILSPDDRPGAMLAKCEQYHDWGVPFCWVIDPETQEAWEYHRGGRPHSVERNGTLHAGELVIQLPELFAEATS